MEFYPEGMNAELDRQFTTPEALRRAMMQGSILESRVLLCDREHNLHVDLGAMRGIIPREEGAVGIDDGTVRDIALISKVGKRVCFSILGFPTLEIRAISRTVPSSILGFQREDDGPFTAILSRRAVQLRCKAEFLDTLEPGDVIPARVTHLEKFGAFIDVGAGLNALIPIDMLSVSRIDHPRARLREGQELRVVLRSREPDKLTFSLKELLGTWQQNAAGFSSGETVPGVVRSVEPYGVFVELTPNLAGLAEPSAALEPGQPVAVYVKSILPEKMKIKLVVVEAFDPPAPVTPLTYYMDGTRMDRWVYSTPTAPRQTVTDFAALRSQEKSTL